jgi:small subunit ribosomal protein S4
MPKRKQKLYAKPKKLFDKVRILEENDLKEKYGLKNKREIWKADAAIGRIRNLAKQLITSSEEEKKAFIERLQKRGFEIDSIADVLALNKEDWLKRRLQTIIAMKGLTRTPKQARQLVAHKHVSIGEQIVNIPSYMVKLEEEPLVKLNIVLKTPEKKKSKIEKIKEEVIEDGKVKENKEVTETKEVPKAEPEVEKNNEIPAQEIQVGATK